MPQADAVFSEILQLEIDTASFASGLAQLESAYDDFLSRIATAGAGANLGGVAAASLIQLNESVTQLQTAFTTFDAEVTSSFADVDAGLKKVQASIQATGQAAIDAKAGIAQEQVSTSSGSGAAVVPVGGAGLGSVVGQIGSAQTGMASLLASVAEFRLLWAAVGEIISVVVDVIKSPFEVIKTGFEYLTKLQDQAASLQGPIAANAKYSADLGKNFQLAGVAAKEVALEFQQMAVKMGVPADQLQHIFSDVLESGGLHFVKTMQDVVSLTQLFQLAMNKTSTDVETQRRTMMEIPKLLDGQNSSGSRILTTLGLTNEQWQKIRSEALAHGDLVEKLSGLMAPYLSVVDEANLRQSRLLDSIKLQSSIIAGAIALPLWQRFTAILQRVSGFLDRNGESLKQLGTETVDLTKEFVVFVGEIAAGLTGTTSLHSLFQSVLETVNNLVGALRIAIEVTSTWGHELGTVAQFGADPFNFFSPKAISDFNSRINAFEANYKAKVKEIFKQGNAVARGFDVNLFFDQNGQFKGAPSLTSGILNNQVSPNKAIPDPEAEKAAAKQREDTFRSLQETFRSELEKTKQKFSETEATIAAQQNTGVISVHEATTQRIAAIHTELAAIQQLVQQYTALAAKSGVKPTEIQKFTTSLSDTGNAAQSTATVQVTNALAKDQANEESITQAHLQRLRQMAIEHSRAMLTIYKQEASEGLVFQEQAFVGLLTKTQLFDKEQELSEQQHAATIAALNQELSSAGNNEKEISRITDAKTAEDQRYTDSMIGSTERRAAIAQKEADDEAAAGELLILLSLRESVARKKAAADGGVAVGDLLKAELALSAQLVKDAQASVDRAQKNLSEAQSIDQKTKATENLLKAQTDLDRAQTEHNSLMTQTPGGSVASAIFGKGTSVQDVKDMLKAPFDDFKGTVDNLGNAMQFFGKTVAGFISAIKSGYAQGGVMGAIGGGASQAGSLLSTLGPAFGPAGAIVSGIGSIFSLLGGLFTAHAKKIAADIQKATQELMQQYSNGQTSLVATINGLEQQRQAAISQLSGQKGGQDQLNQLLPQLDNQIAQLQLQQKQVKTTFEQSLAVLQTHSQTIGQLLGTWQQINKQVKDYLDAGGDAAKAAQFLSLSLQQQQQTAQNSLNDAENQSIQDAMQLNDLLTQRVSLAKQFAQQEFDLKNQGALERMANPAVNAALNYQQQKAANDAQLTALDQQITLYTSRVNMEKQVFNLAQSTADLQARSNQLNLTALQQTIQGWKDLQKIVSSITQNSAGLYGINPNLFTPAASGSVNNSKVINIGAGAVQVTVTGASAADGQAIAAALSKELNLLGQYGTDTSYA